MSRPPHSLALFSLRPYNNNERAACVVSHPDNIHLMSTLSDGIKALDVGFHIRGKSSTTLATLGRGVEADIYIEGSSIAKVQCSFEIDLETGVVMLYDRSHGCTTQVYGEKTAPFEYGRIRKVLVQAELNTVIGMGGAGRNLVEFQLKWHQDPKRTAETIKNYDAVLCARVVNPRLIRTVDEAPTDLPSRRVTRPHTATQLKMRHVQVGAALGSGAYGTVHKAIDIDTGRFIAVKVLMRPEGRSQEAWRELLKREVEALCSLNHPNIISYLGSEGWGEPKLKVFMGLMKGSVKDLVLSRAETPAVANSVFRQILEALDHIAWKGIIHRDVKPENILYEPQPDGKYQCQLADFGLCNRAINAKTLAGTELFMAPEMLKDTMNQTSKVDIWSFFVTMLWILDPKFREMVFRNYEDLWNTILSVASKGELSTIQEMVILDPARRASAAQMLIKCYKGEGLSTPLNQVQALASGAPLNIAAARAPAPSLFNRTIAAAGAPAPSPFNIAAAGAPGPGPAPGPLNIAAVRAPAPGPLTFTAQARRLGPRGLRTNANVFAAATQHRIERARAPLQPQPVRRLQDDDDDDDDDDMLSSSGALATARTPGISQGVRRRAKENSRRRQEIRQKQQGES